MKPSLWLALREKLTDPSWVTGFRAAVVTALVVPLFFGVGFLREERQNGADLDAAWRIVWITYTLMKILVVYMVVVLIARRVRTGT